MQEVFQEQGLAPAVTVRMPQATVPIADAVRHCALPPYRYPIIPLKIDEVPRATAHPKAASDHHASLLMRLAWPPKLAVALPHAWQGLCLAQVVALVRGFIGKATRLRIEAATEAGTGLQDVMAAGQKIELLPNGDFITARTVPVSALRVRQGLLDGALSCRRHAATS